MRKVGNWNEAGFLKNKYMCSHVFQWLPLWTVNGSELDLLACPVGFKKESVYSKTLGLALTNNRDEPNLSRLD